ncbi:RNA polymerase sigma factor [Variovorax sp. ZT5P49]|uniref:RNA polymerase sigma factor n=1 Tax=Variovorax sp. ZT5P49 TaxID=3443733 RepID=UPI003F48F84C
MLDASTWICVDAFGSADGEQVGETARSGTSGILLRDVLVANYIVLHHRLTRHLGCPDLASECLHDAWLRLGDLTVFTSMRSPEAYVYRTACNLAMDCLRSSRAWQYTSDADTELERIIDLSPGPELIAEARSDLVAVDRAMNRLPRRHQEILLGLRVHEMTRQEVAIRQGLSLRRVDNALSKALEHCADYLNKSCAHFEHVS